jgi:hypothetical protein
LLWSDSSWSRGLGEEPSPGKYDWLIVSPVLRVLISDCGSRRDGKRRCAHNNATVFVGRNNLGAVD